MTSKPHIIVIGGGPAGCAAAGQLLEMSLAVTLIERGRAQRDKPCGDLFMPYAVKSLRQLGISEYKLAQLGGISFNRIEFYRNGRLMFTIPYPENDIWVIPRRNIDQKLRDRINEHNNVLYEIAVVDIRHSGDGIDIEVLTSDHSRRLMRCDAVIIAAGSGNPLGARLGVSGRPFFAPAVSGYVAGKCATVPAFEFVDELPEGYCWRFPLAQGGANIGVCSRKPRKKSDLLKLANGLAQRFGIAETIAWRFGAGGLWSGQGIQWHSDIGIVSCGDAAGVIDPVTTEGLSQALYTGELAGKAIASHVEGTCAAVHLEQYSALIRQEFGSAYGNSLFRAAWSELCRPLADYSRISG